jgi:hypothetical protein
VPLHLARAWECFGDLARDRQIGMAAGPIPWSAVDRWAARNGVDGDEFDRLKTLVFALDAEWLALNAPKDGKAPAVEAPMSDPAAVKNILSGLGTR